MSTEPWNCMIDQAFLILIFAKFKEINLILYSFSGIIVNFGIVFVSAIYWTFIKELNLADASIGPVLLSEGAQSAACLQNTV